MKKLFAVLFAAALVVSFIVPASAEVVSKTEGMNIVIDGKITWGGSIDKSDGVRRGLTAAQYMNDDSDLDWFTKGELVFNWSKGPLGAFVKFDAGDTTNFKEYNVSYNWGAFSTEFGKAKVITKADVLPGGPGGIGTGDYTGFNGGANPRLLVKVPLGPVTLTFDGVQPSNHQAYVTGASTWANNATPIPGGSDLDTSQPALEARVDFAVGPFAGAFYGGMYEYEEVYTGNDTVAGVYFGEKTYDIDSEVIGFAAKAGFGPLTFSGTIWEDTNNYNNNKGSWPGRPSYFNPVYMAGTDSIMDSETTGWQLGLQYKITPMFSAAARYGEFETEWDNPALFAAGTRTGYEEDAYGLNLDINIMPGMGAAIAYRRIDGDWTYSPGTAATMPTGAGKTTNIRWEWWIAF